MRPGGDQLRAGGREAARRAPPPWPAHFPSSRQFQLGSSSGGSPPNSSGRWSGEALAGLGRRRIPFASGNRPQTRPEGAGEQFPKGATPRGWARAGSPRGPRFVPKPLAREGIHAGRRLLPFQPGHWAADTRAGRSFAGPRSRLLGEVVAQ